MNWIGEIVPMLGVIFVATLVRSIFGFGEALIAVPLLALIIPVEAAVPLATLVSVMVAGLVVVQDWRQIQFRSVGWLLVSTLFGIPLGLLLLTRVEARLVKAILATLIISFSTYCLVRRRPFELKDDRFAWFFGFTAGVLGGAYGMNGPPLVVYGTVRGWTATHFRATLQGYFLPASLVGLAGYWAIGIWTASVTRYFLLSLPIALVAVVLGRIINQHMKASRFVLYVHIGLLLVGSVLLVQAAWRRTSPHPVSRHDLLVHLESPAPAPRARRWKHRSPERVAWSAFFDARYPSSMLMRLEPGEVVYMIHHLLSHTESNDWLKVNRFFTEQLACIARKLDEVQEGSRTPLDNSKILFLSSMMTGGHDNRPLPVVMLGRGGGAIRTGRIFDYLGKPNRGMCSLYLSLMDRAGVHLDSFGDSKERLAEI